MASFARQGSATEDAKDDDAKESLMAGSRRQKPDYEDDSLRKTVEFIKETFSKRECNRYIKDPKSATDECGCGREKSEHGSAEEDGATEGLVWNSLSHTTLSETDAFGEVEFLDYGQKKGKFIRVEHQTDVDDLWSLMRDHWQMEKPQLLISVTGGAKDYRPKMKPRLKEAFCKGLVQTAESTDAWVITGGTNEGVMKLVGEAMKQRSKKRLTVVGIASWGRIANRHRLIARKDEALYEFSYAKPDEGTGKDSSRAGEVRGTSKESALDPNHTHFILVDDGRTQYGGEIDLRAKLESKISKMEGYDDHSVPIPIICILLEGGKGTIKTAKEALENNTPVLVIEGSGRAADVLAEAYRLFREAEESESQQSKKPKDLGSETDIWVEIKKSIEKNLNTTQTADIIVNIKACLRQIHLMTVFRLDDTNAAENIHHPIIETLLRVNKDDRPAQLGLALAWNRIDIAREHIYPEDIPVSSSALENPMFRGITDNRVEFVKFFLEKEIRLSDFLQNRQLSTLYDETLKKTKYLNSIASQSEKTDMRKLKNLMRDLVSGLFNPLLHLPPPEATKGSHGTDGASSTVTSPDDEGDRDRGVVSGPKVETYDDDSASMQLFFWSIIARLPSMAMIFWYEAKEKLALSLIGHLMSKNIQEKEKDLESKESLEKQITFFESLATKVLSECYSFDHQKTVDLLVRKMEHFSDLTVLEIAVRAENKAFLAHPACQNLLTEIWMGALSEENHVIKLLISMILFPLAPRILQFRTSRKESEKIKADSKKSAKNKDKNKKSDSKGETPPAPVVKPEVDEPWSCSSYCKKLKRFAKAPVVKFGYNCLSYVVLLLLYGIILLTEFFPTISLKEIVLIIWITTILLEELRQFLATSSRSFGEKLYNYIRDIWNALDVVAGLTFVVGISLRFIPTSFCESCFYVSRIILALNFMMFFFRILHMFSIHRQLGPKLVMIGKMMIDLFYFMIILMVFISAYGVASHVILYPNQPPSIAMVRDVLSGAWWSVYGEFNIEEVSGQECDPSEFHTTTAGLCASMDQHDLNRSSCPGKEEKCPTNDWFGPILLAVYALITNVMMINLLIAMFSNTFAKVEEMADVVWKTQRCHLMLEYESRPVFPPPLIIFEHLFYLLRSVQSCFLRHQCLKECCHTDLSSAPHKSRFRMGFGRYYEKELLTWLSIRAEEFLTKKETEEADSFTRDQTPKRMDEIIERLNRLDTVEMKLDRLSEILEGKLRPESDRSDQQKL